MEAASTSGPPSASVVNQYSFINALGMSSLLQESACTKYERFKRILIRQAKALSPSGPWRESATEVIGSALDGEYMDAYTKTLKSFEEGGKVQAARAHETCEHFENESKFKDEEDGNLLSVSPVHVLSLNAMSHAYQGRRWTEML